MRARLRQAARRLGRGFNCRVFCWVFVAMMVAVAVYAVRQPRVYEAQGRLEFIKAPERPADNFVDANVNSSWIDLRTIRDRLASPEILQLVIERLTTEERVSFFEPYGSLDRSEEEITRLILANRTLTTDPVSLIVELRFQHPSREMATRVVHLFLEEMDAYEKQRRRKDEADAVHELTIRAEQAKFQIAHSDRAIAAFREGRSNLEEQPNDNPRYRSLIESLEKQKEYERAILSRLAEMHSLDPSRSLYGWLVQYPVIPEDDDYLFGPFCIVFARGAPLAVFTAVLAAMVFKRQATGINQQEDL